MSTIHFIPRPGCTHFAKCGSYSLGFCRRHGSSECPNCNIVKRKPKNRVLVNGEERKLCTHCKREFPLHRFYERTVVRKGKVYNYLSSHCRYCLSAANNDRQRKNRINQEGILSAREAGGVLSIYTQLK